MQPQVTLAMVMSVDGKSTKWHQPKIHDWTSSEDRAFFSQLLRQHHVIIMGRKTYLAAKTMMKLTPNLLRVVCTRDPESYQATQVDGQLEFTNASPAALCDDLIARGYQKILLVGGAELNAAFFSSGLVHNVWITVEPHLFGQGDGFVASVQMDIPLHLISVERLNERGTLLLRYQVLTA